MKTTRILILMVLITFVNKYSFSQDTISSDTIISKQINLLDSFCLNFRTCVSCGYNWFVVDPIDSTKLKCFETGVSQNNHLVGGSVIKTWTYQGLAKGYYQLVYIYKRPWLKDYLKKAIINIEVD